VEIVSDLKGTTLTDLNIWGTLHSSKFKGNISEPKSVFSLRVK